MPSETKTILQRYFQYMKYFKTSFITISIIFILIATNYLNDNKILLFLLAIEVSILIILIGLSLYFISKILQILEPMDLTFYKRDIEVIERFKSELINIKEEIIIRENELNKIIDSAPDNHKNFFKNDGKLISLEEKAQKKKDEILFLENLSKYIKEH